MSTAGQAGQWIAVQNNRPRKSAWLATPFWIASAPVRRLGQCLNLNKARRKVVPRGSERCDLRR